MAGWEQPPSILQVEGCRYKTFGAFCTAVFVTETGNTISDGKGVHFCQDFRFRAAVAPQIEIEQAGEVTGKRCY